MAEDSLKKIFVNSDFFEENGEYFTGGNRQKLRIYFDNNKHMAVVIAFVFSIGLYA